MTDYVVYGTSRLKGNFFTRSHQWVVILAFGVVYSCSLVFSYVEGDDARTVLYHALGRNPGLQPPYGAYQGMMDTLLALLPPQELLLRVTAFSISSLSAIIFVLLAFQSVFAWLEPLPKSTKVVSAFVILFACPELFYLGLVYTPSLTAIWLVVFAHLLLRPIIQESGCFPKRLKRKGNFILSLVLFGVGTACRWDIGAYGLVILGDLFLRDEMDSINQFGLEPKRVALGIVWGILAVVSVLAAIELSGYGVKHFYSILRLARKEATSPRSWYSVFGAFQTLFTPGFLALVVVGAWALCFSRLRAATLVGLGILPVLPFVFSREPKMIIPALPGLFACAIKGVSLIFCSSHPSRAMTVSKSILSLVIFLPWIFGVQVYSRVTSWGPGFQVRRPRDLDQEKNATLANHWLSLGGGFAVPTPEGPRPVGGHAAVLLGGEWRTLITELDHERRNAALTAISERLPMLQDDDSAYLATHLLRLDFKTSDPNTRRVSNGLCERRFFNDDGLQVSLFSVDSRDSLFDKDQIQELLSLVPGSEVILYSVYSSTIRRLSQEAPEAILPLGAFSGRLELTSLIKAIRTHDKSRS